MWLKGFVVPPVYVNCSLSHSEQTDILNFLSISVTFAHTKNAHAPLVLFLQWPDTTLTSCVCHCTLAYLGPSSRIQISAFKDGQYIEYSNNMSICCNTTIYTTSNTAKHESLIMTYYVWYSAMHMCCIACACSHLILVVNIYSLFQQSLNHLLMSPLSSFPQGSGAHILHGR